MHIFPHDYNTKGDIFFPSSNEDIPEFTYSDGESFEADIHRIITGSQDRSLFSSELKQAIWDWRSACHLSPVRTNILRPLESVCKGRVLELGCGCGIITRYLGELGADVVALEASAQRALITRERTVDLENVTVVCDRIEDFEAAEKFDVVTLIGVLQYARMFSHCGPQAEIDLLQNAVRQLKPGGLLVISIQNKLALKYFSGFPEPNVDVPYYGIENRYGPEDIIRFGYNEIKDLLGSIGLKERRVLFPLPDYHMPVSILSEIGAIPSELFSAEALLELAVNRDRARPDWIAPAFSLEKAWATINANGMTAYMANSFLTVASTAPDSLKFLDEGKVLAWHYSADRFPSFATAKQFAVGSDGVVVTRKRITSHQQPNVPIVHHADGESYLKGRLWWSYLVDILNNPGWAAADICKWARVWIDEIASQAGIGPAISLSLDQRISGTMFDWTPLNCIRVDENRLHFFDKEWEIQADLDFSYLILRGLFGSLSSVASCAEPATGTTLNILNLLIDALRLQSIGITDQQIEKYIAQESSIQHWVNKGTDSEISKYWADYIHSASLVVRPNFRNLANNVAPPPRWLSEEDKIRENLINQLKDAQDRLQHQESREVDLRGQLDAARDALSEQKAEIITDISGLNTRVGEITSNLESLKTQTDAISLKISLGFFGRAARYVKRRLG